MQYRTLGSSTLNISVVSVGTWVYGGKNWGKVADNESIASIQKAIDLGINLIDTAPVYGDGHAEEIVGKAIKGNRDKVFIATKCGLQKKERTFVHDLSPAAIRKELEKSLARLHIDHIDLYQCHWPDPQTPIEATMEEMLKMQSEGKISTIGVSNFDQTLLEKALRVGRIVSLQIQYSLMERGVEENHLLEFCIKNGVGVMTYGSLGGGILTGKYKKQPTFPRKDARRFFYPFYSEQNWGKYHGFVEAIRKIAQEKKKPVVEIALSWLIQRPGVTTALVGVRTVEQAEKNVQAIQGELSEIDREKIKEIYDKFIKNIN